MRRAIAVGAALGLLILANGSASASELTACVPSPSAAPAPQDPLTAIPCVDGFAGPYPCKNIDLLSFVPLATMECESGNSLTGWTDPLDGKEYALMGCNNGISFVDISAPESPVYLGRLPTHEHTDGPAGGTPEHEGNSLWRDVRVYANHAFVASEQPEHHMQVFDLTQLRSVASPPVVFAESALYEGVSTTHTVAVNEATGFIYLAGTNTCDGGLNMVDVQDPLNPTFAGCVADDGYTHETQCVAYSGPDADYAGHELCFSSNVDTLTIVDVTNKSAPVQISRTGYAGSGYTHQGWLTEDQAHFLLNDELDEVNNGHNSYTYIWDLRDLDAPVLMGHYTGPTRAIDHNLYIRGGYAYESNYRAGLRILDATGVAAAVLNEVAFFDMYPADDEPEFNANWNNYPFFQSGVVILSGIEQGLYVVQPNLEPNPTSLLVSEASVAEGDAGAVNLSFTVSLSFAVPRTVTVSYSTGLGNATPGVDYTPVSGVLTFDPLETAKSVDVAVQGDLLDESNEIFFLNLTNAAGAAIADASGRGTILDNDPEPSLAISDVAVAEGNTGSAVASFLVSLSTPSGQTVSASWSTAALTATAGSDFVAASGVVTFAAGATSRSIDVLVQGDLAGEADETFLVDLTSPSHTTLSDSQAIGTILDDDVLGVLSVSPSSGPASGAAITISGAAFQTGATVTVGGIGATNVVVVGPGSITALTPALAPGSLNDVTVDNPGSIPVVALASAFFADYLDVDALHPFHDFVETVARNGVTAGCGGGNYCPDASVTRAQMAVFLLKGKYGSSHVPPAATGTVFGDVPQGSFGADWIEELAALEVTGGCGNGNYCPDALVTRAQMAVFLLKAAEDPGYAPPTATGAVFGDVPQGSFAADWIEELASRGVTGGCGNGNYCPGSPNTRGQMAVFLVRNFGL